MNIIFRERVFNRTASVVQLKVTWQSIAPARSDFPTFVSATWIRESISCHSATEKQSDFTKPRTFISHDLSSLGFSDLVEVRDIFPRCEIDPIIL